MGERANPFHGIRGVRQRRIAAVVLVILAADGEADPITWRHHNASGPDFHIHLDRFSGGERPFLVMGVPGTIGQAEGWVGFSMRHPQPAKRHGSAGIIGTGEHTSFPCGLNRRSTRKRSASVVDEETYSFAAEGPAISTSSVIGSVRNVRPSPRVS